MDGLEATQRIREYECQQGIKRLPILGLTAHAIQGYEETCLKSGMDGYLGKPFDIDQLLRVIHKYVPPKDAIILRRLVFRLMKFRSELLTIMSEWMNYLFLHCKWYLSVNSLILFAHILTDINLCR